MSFHVINDERCTVYVCMGKLMYLLETHLTNRPTAKYLKRDNVLSLFLCL